jgi:hypothetical protein
MQQQQEQFIVGYVKATVVPENAEQHRVEFFFSQWHEPQPRPNTLAVLRLDPDGRVICEAVRPVTELIRPPAEAQNEAAPRPPVVEIENSEPTDNAPKPKNRLKNR